MASDPPKELLDSLDALRAIRALHASRRDAGSLRIGFGIVGLDQKPDQAATLSSTKPSALIPQL